MSTKDEILRICAEGPFDSAITVLFNYTEVDRPSQHELACAAAGNEQVEIFRYILDSGDVVLDRDVPIKDIITKHSTSLIQVLLDRGWDINSNLGSYRGCALAWSLMKHSPLDFIHWLLDHGADPNGPYGGPDHLGHSLRIAAAGVYRDVKADVAIAELLLRYGADVNGSRALHKAGEMGNLHIVQLLVQDPWNADVNYENFDPHWEQNMKLRRPLHCAVVSENVEVVRLLLGKGADASAKDSKGNTPKQIAEMNGWKEGASLLQQWETKC